MDKIAVRGSTTDHGGIIITGSGTVSVNFKQVARKGDLHSCPIPGHGVNNITDNCVETLTANNIPIAKVGSICGCGAVIITGENVKI